MKFVKWILIPIVLLCMIGFAVYYFGYDYASEKVIDKVSEELETSGKMEEIKEVVKNDPALSSFIKEVETMPEVSQYLTDSQETKESGAEKSTPDNNKEGAAPVTEKGKELPFSTKEEAMKVVVDRVGISQLTNMANQYREGTASKEELIQEVSSQFTEEEITALKVIAYKELYGQ